MTQTMFYWPTDHLGIRDEHRMITMESDLPLVIVPAALSPAGETAVSVLEMSP